MGPELSLRTLRGDAVDWAEIEAMLHDGVAMVPNLSKTDDIQEMAKADVQKAHLVAVSALTNSQNRHDANGS